MPVSPLPVVAVKNGPKVRSATLTFAVPTDNLKGRIDVRPTARPVTVVAGKEPKPRFDVPLTLTRYPDGATYFLGFDLRGYDGVYDVVLTLGEVEYTIATFHQLFGDVDGDGRYDAADHAKVGASVDVVAGDLGFQPSLDFNEDGVVSAVDIQRPGGVGDTPIGTEWAY